MAGQNTEPLLGSEKPEATEGHRLEDHVRMKSSGSFMESWRNEKTNVGETEVLEFIIQRLSMHAEKIGDANGVHHNLQRLCKVVRELEHVDGLHFNIQHYFSRAMMDVDGLCPFPTAADVNNCLDKLNEVSYLEIPDTDMILVQFAQLLAQNADMHQEHEYEKKKEIIEMAKSKAKLVGVVAVNAVREEFMKFPILGWFLGSLYKDLRDFSNFAMFEARWELPFPKMKHMMWVQIGDICKRAIQSERIKEQAFLRGAPLDAMDEVQSTVLPQFLFSLTALKVVLMQQVKQASDTKAKIIATSMTLFITFGQLAMHALYNKVEAGSE